VKVSFLKFLSNLQQWTGIFNVNSGVKLHPFVTQLSHVIET